MRSVVISMSGEQLNSHKRARDTATNTRACITLARYTGMGGGASVSKPPKLRKRQLKGIKDWPEMDDDCKLDRSVMHLMKTRCVFAVVAAHPAHP
jgi:hypothetical protein